MRLAGVSDGPAEAVPAAATWRQRLIAASWLGWGLADQALSSLTNFALGILAARTLAPEAFGSFSIAFTTYLVALAIGRGLVTQPLSVRFSRAEPAAWRAGVAGATGTALVVGLLTGVVCAAVGFMTSGPLRVSLLALAATLPGLLLQDAWRYAFFAAGRGGQAFLNDLLWSVVQFSTLAAMAVRHELSLVGILLSWGGAATVAAYAGGRQAGVRPRFGACPAWLRAQRDLAARFLGENVVYSSEAFLCTAGLGAIASLSAVSAVRAAAIVLQGPLLVAFIGISNAAVPHAVRALGRSTGRLLELSVRIGVGESVLALAWGVSLLLTPDRLGNALLGQAWPSAKGLLLPLTVWLAVGALAGGCRIGLRALGAARRSLWAQVVQTVLVVPCMLGGAAWDGARGAVWCLTGATVLATVEWWRQYLAELGSHGHRRTLSTRPG